MPEIDLEQDEQAPIRRLSTIERPGQALQNILEGNLPGAWDSLLRPEELTPVERDAFLRKHGLDRGPFAPIYRLLTNPTLIISLATSYAFPIPTAKNMFELSKKVGSLTSRLPILGEFLSTRALFRGTEVPEVLAKIASDRNAFHTKYFPKLSTAFQGFEEVMGRSVTNREQVLVSAYLDGLHRPLRGFQGHKGVVTIGTDQLPGVGVLIPNLEAKMGKPLLQVAQRLRGTLNEMWGEIFGDEKARTALARAITRKRGDEIGPDLIEALEDWVLDPRKVPDYFPHRILKTDVDFREMMAVLTESTSEKARAAKAMFKATTWVGPEAMKREFGMLPALDDLQRIRDVVDPKAYQNAVNIMQARLFQDIVEQQPNFSRASLEKLKRLPMTGENSVLTTYAQYLHPREQKMFSKAIADNMPRQYSLKLAPVLQSYTHSMTGTYAWTTKGGGEAVREVSHELQNLADNPYAKRRLEMLENTLVPMAMGRGTFKQVLRSQAWDFEMTRLSAFLDKPSVLGTLGPTLTKYVQKTMQQSRGAFSLLNLNRSLASYFYLNTLGLNPASALKNLLQTVMTTGPTIGYKTAAEGAQVAFKKSHKYFALRLGAQKLEHEAALAAAYPEFTAAGVQAAPMMDEALQNALRNATDLAGLPTGKLVKAGDRVGRAMMAMFTASENANRLLTFEGGMIHAARGGLKGQDALDFSRKLVEITQFSTGPHNTPVFLLNKSPLFRQFLQFPMKMMEFAASTAWTLGSGQRTIGSALGLNPNLSGPFNVLSLNPGTAARVLVGSTLAIEAGEILGLDVKDSLLDGAMPGLRGEGVLAPLPQLPPFIQILGAAGLAAATGDMTELTKQVPLLVPAGVPTARAIGMLPPEVPGAEWGRAAAQALQRQYADYTQPAPDGRIAVYTGKDKLRGYYTPWQLVASAMGVGAGDMQKESELLKTLVANREQIREYRRAWLEARFGNDTGKTSRIEAEYKQRYGSPLPVSEDDIATMQKRRQMTRLEQMVETLPPGPEREQFVRMITASLGGEATNLLGVEPSLLGEPSSVRAQSRAGILRRTPYTNLMGPMGPGVNPATVGRQPYPNTNYMGY
jgi:hypothetical protein